MIKEDPLWITSRDTVRKIRVIICSLCGKKVIIRGQSVNANIYYKTGEKEYLCGSCRRKKNREKEFKREDFSLDNIVKSVV